ncbi:MAG: iron dependent repressor, metal binding and dimerization domain protein [Tepidanaerobacteraceae bacterium]|nr:DtxR family transcriptional regulator [Tepidanaerobacter sp.]HQA60975.1 iron dependent repressor, metal binding and dimerization domain protein [Tepidanaerobacteraceae bacterium]HQE06182.1 iron dependent repressor, metal binding and dimerization domain protein [Tepidanaerobacteraceae bacterium]
MENNAGFYTYRGYELLRQEKLRLSPSMEDYLEMIYRTCKKQGYIRMTSLAQQLNVQASSATKTVQKLAEMKLLAYEKYGIIQLTEEGRKIGEFLLKRHRIVETFLKNIGVKENLLRQTEMIEHHLTADTVRSIDMLNKFFKEYPEIHKQFLQFLIN